MNPDELGQVAELGTVQSVGEDSPMDDAPYGSINADDLRKSGIVPEAGAMDAEPEAVAESVEGEEVAPEEATEEGQETGAEENPVKPQNRAQARIAELVEQRNAAKAEAEALRSAQAQQYQQLQWQMQQQAQQAQALQQQQAEWQHQQLALAQSARAREDDKNLTDGQRIEREWIRKAESAALAKLSPEIAQLKQALQQRDQQAQQQQAEYQRQARFQHFTSEAQKVASEQILKGFDPTEVQALSGPASDMFLTYWTAFGVDASGRSRNPAEVAAEFKGFLDKYVAGSNKVKSGIGAKIKQPAVAAKPVPGRAVAGGVAQSAEFKPTDAQITKAGWRSRIAWITEGKPKFSLGKK